MTARPSARPHINLFGVRSFVCVHVICMLLVNPAFHGEKGRERETEELLKKEADLKVNMSLSDK